MITIIENINFVEGIFLNTNEAENYLIDHPQKENCKIINNESASFPFFIVEYVFGKFDYCFTKEELIDYIKNIDKSKLQKSKYTIFSSNSNNIERKEDLDITVYLIRNPFVSNNKNNDTMGWMEHDHIRENEIDEIKNGNTEKLFVLKWFDRK